jgi:hypothetical protein
MPIRCAGGVASIVAACVTAVGSAAAADGVTAAQAIMQSIDIFAGVSGVGAGMSLQCDITA